MENVTFEQRRKQSEGKSHIFQGREKGKVLSRQHLVDSQRVRKAREAKEEWASRKHVSDEVMNVIQRQGR